MGLTATAGSLAATPVLASPQAPAQGVSRDVPRAAIRFDIPAGPLADVLAAFERVTGVKTMLVMPELARCRRRA